MAIGTAGFNVAMLAVMALEKQGLSADSGPGGFCHGCCRRVGSVADCGALSEARLSNVNRLDRPHVGGRLC